LPVADLEEAYAYAEAHNPLIRAAQERERASRASVEGAKADRRPRLDFQGTAALLPIPRAFPTIRTPCARPKSRASSPCPARCSTAASAPRIHAAEAANDADWRLMDATLRENRATLAGAWNDWQAQTTAIDNLARAVDSAQKAYDGAVLQERAGMFTTLDVLQLARELLQARSAYNEGIAGAYLAKAQVLAALGALDAAWLLPDAPGTTRRRMPGAYLTRPTFPDHRQRPGAGWPGRRLRPPAPLARPRGADPRRTRHPQCR
jgi:hypothetical protein